MATNPQGLLRKTPTFFKIVFDSQAPRLRIPEAYARKYGRNLSHKVFLKVPNGSVWEVELHHSNGGVWLDRGWNEFKDHYSITFGHFLVFEYQGNSCFRVLIFDKTATEIENSTYNGKNRAPGTEEAGSESDSDSVVFLGDSTAKMKCKGKRILEEGENEDDHDDAFVKILKDIGQSGRGEKRNSTKAIVPKEFPGDCQKGKLRKMALIPSAQSKKLIKLEVLDKISPAEHQENGNLLKRNLLNDFVPHKKTELIALPVKLEERDGGQSGRRAKQETIEKHCSSAYQAATKFMSENSSRNPYFIRLIQPCLMYDFRVPVPLGFVKSNLPETRNSVTLRLPNGKTWSVECNVARERGCVGKGWKDFVTDNGIKAGDVCVFQVQKRDKPSWNVILFRC